MKNKFNLLVVLAIMVFVIGCSCGKTWDFGSSEPKSNTPTKTTEKQADSGSSNKSVADRATDVVTEGEKIGIPECDELMDYFRTYQSDHPAQAIKELSGDYSDEEIQIMHIKFTSDNAN